MSPKKKIAIGTAVGVGAAGVAVGGGIGGYEYYLHKNAP